MTIMYAVYFIAAYAMSSALFALAFVNEKSIHEANIKH